MTAAGTHENVPLTPGGNVGHPTMVTDARESNDDRPRPGYVADDGAMEKFKTKNT